MAVRVQIKDLHRVSSAKDAILSACNWRQTGETTSEKLQGLLKKRGDIVGQEVILNLEPMVSWKWVVVKRVSNGCRDGMVLKCI